MRAVLRDRKRATGLVIMAGVAVLLGLVSLGVERQPGDSGPFALAATFMGSAVGCLLAARRGAEPGVDGVRLQYLVRSRFLRWDEVDHFGFADTRNWFGERLKKPLAILRSGEKVVVPGADQVRWMRDASDRMRFPVLDKLEHHRTAS